MPGTPVWFIESRRSQFTTFIGLFSDVDADRAVVCTRRKYEISLHGRKLFYIRRIFARPADRNIHAGSAVVISPPVTARPLYRCACCTGLDRFGMRFTIPCQSWAFGFGYIYRLSSRRI